MRHVLKRKAGAIVLCGGLGMTLTPACDLSYTCATVEPGSAGAGYPTESVGAGDFPSNGEEDEGGGEEVGSAQLEMAGSCSPSKTCTDMFEACQNKGYPCTREIEYKKTLCAICQRNCINKHPYKYSECYEWDLSDHG